MKTPDQTRQLQLPEVSPVAIARGRGRWQPAAIEATWSHLKIEDLTCLMVIRAVSQHFQSAAENRSVTDYQEGALLARTILAEQYCLQGERIPTIKPDTQRDIAHLLFGNMIQVAAGTIDDYPAHMKRQLEPSGCGEAFTEALTEESLPLMAQIGGLETAFVYADPAHLQNSGTPSRLH